MEFLQQSWRRFIDFFLVRKPRDENDLPTMLDMVTAGSSIDLAGETLARFIPDRGRKGRISTQRGEAKVPAFMPMLNRELQRFETSTFRIAGLGDGEVWRLAVDHVEPTQGRVIASANLNGSSVFDAGLSIDPDDTPPRHACIIGWPEEKDAQLEHALLLRSASWLKMR